MNRLLLIGWLLVGVAVFGLLAVTAYQAFLNSQIL